MTSNQITVNTSHISQEDFNTFLDCSERIQKSEERPRRKVLKKAVKTHEEIFEAYEERQPKRVREDRVLITRTVSLDNLLKYFGEDVVFDSDPQTEMQSSPEKIKPIVRNGGVVFERSVRPSEVKQREMKPYHESQDDTMKRSIMENLFNGNGHKETKKVANELKPILKPAVSGRQTNGSKTSYIEPSAIKPCDGDSCLKPSNLKTSVILRPASSTITPIKSNDVRSGRRAYMSETKSRPRTPIATPIPNGIYPENEEEVDLNETLKNLDSSFDSKSSTFKRQTIEYFKQVENTPNSNGYVKLSDLDLSPEEWQARYIDIMKAEQSSSNEQKQPYVTPSDLNLTQQEWDARYFNILQMGPKSSSDRPSSLGPNDSEEKTPPIASTRSQIPVQIQMFKADELEGKFQGDDYHKDTEKTHKSVILPIRSSVRELTNKFNEIVNGKPVGYESVKMLQVQYQPQARPRSVLASKGLHQQPTRLIQQTQPDVQSSKIKQLIQAFQSSRNQQDEQPQSASTDQRTQESEYVQPASRVKEVVQALQTYQNEQKSSTQAQLTSKARNIQQPARTTLQFSEKPNISQVNAKDSKCLVPEEIFHKLSVKDKALLFNKFIDDVRSNGLNITSIHPPDVDIQNDVSEDVFDVESALDNSLHKSPDKDVSIEQNYSKSANPPRRKTKRSTLSWNKDACMVEKKPHSSSDSDHDQLFKTATNNSFLEQQYKGKKLSFKDCRYMLPPLRISDQDSSEIDENLMHNLNSPSKTRSAYTLTVLSSSSPATESVISTSSEETEQRIWKTTLNKTASENDDQGFETGSYGCTPDKKPHDKSIQVLDPISDFERSPLFMKLSKELRRRRAQAPPAYSSCKKSEVGLPSPDHSTPERKSIVSRRKSGICQVPSSYSTPIKNNVNKMKISPARRGSWHTVFSPIQNSICRKSLNDSDTRRSSARNSTLMDVIREEQHDYDGNRSVALSELEDDVFLPTTLSSSDDFSGSSSFWISTGAIKLFMNIFENNHNRLSHLYDIFSQKSAETREVRFGIDNRRYSPKEGATMEDIAKTLPEVAGVSNFWIASGDLAIPFQGNFIDPAQVNRIFTFIKESSSNDTKLRFGVDNFEFSQIQDPRQKFSFESNYSMLTGLNGQSYRHKFAWPRTSQRSATGKTSDFDPSDFDSDFLGSGRLSFSPYGSSFSDTRSKQSADGSTPSFGSVSSPELFSFEYENESLEKMFDRKKQTPTQASDTYTADKRKDPLRANSIDKMISAIHQQQTKLKDIEHQMKLYTNPEKLAEIIRDYRMKPDVKKLRNIVATIHVIGKDGFANCSAKELETFLFYITLYADTCLTTCSDSMNKIMDKLMEENIARACTTAPPENELQKSHDNTTRLSEHQLRVQASLQRLNIPDWFRQYNNCLPKSPDVLGYKPGNANFTRKRTSDSGRWTGLNSKTTSLSSLGSQRSDRSPLLLSPSAHSHHGGQTSIGSVIGSSGAANVSGGFSRWSTSYLNSTQTSPSVSTRGSFSRGGPVNSSFISTTSSTAGVRSSFRQPYLGWRSQEKLSQPRTPHERLASSLLAQRSPKSEQPVTPEIQTSIKEVTSAIVHYVNDQTNRNTQRSRSASPNSRKCWLESSFVGIRPMESPQTPIIDNSTFSNTSTGGLNHSYHNTTSATSSIHSSIGLTNLTTIDGLRINGVGAPERTMSSASLEDVLASLLGLPPTQVPTANDTYRSTGDTASEAVNLRMTSSTSPGSLQVVDQQARFRRRSEGDAQRQQQQQQLQQTQNCPIHNANKQPPPTVNNCHPESVQTPRRVSLDSSESKTTSELQIKCRNTKCDQAATPLDAKKFYKSCHNCSHLYCSRECRRAHWEKHRKACLHSRASNLCRQVLSACKDDIDTQRHLSLLARKGYLSQGRGVVRVLFRSAESAEGFIKHGFQCMGEASYVRWPDLMPAEMGLELYSELLKLSTEYKPDSKMLIYVAICVVSEAPGTATAPVKWERQLVSRCAKLKLCKSVLTELEHTQQQIVVIPEPATEILILTFNPAKRSTPSQREVILTNITTILNRRGVILRKHYPEIYQRLQTYAEGQTDRFNAVTLHPRDSQTGQGFVCIIMPLQSDSEIIKMPCSDGGNKVLQIDVGEDLMES